MRPILFFTFVIFLSSLRTFAADAVSGPVLTRTSGSAPASIATFHCVGLYWSPSGGESGKRVLVHFRKAAGGGATAAWEEALPMRYNPIKTPECKADYRGSIVNLTPGTTYEVALELEGTDVHASLTATTWAEQFPVAATIRCASGAATLSVNKSGTPDGYVLYDGGGCVLDCGDNADLGIAVNASYVILRGFTIKHVRQHGIRILGGHHIVIEGCDISQWGSEEGNGFGFEQQAAVYSKNKDLRCVVVQRCKLHHPNWDSNSWAEDHYKDRPSRHPDGPQAIVFWECEGNHVIRYNECWSDKDHYFNDVIGGGKNGSYRGFPGADSDIYGNYIANCWDDGIEAEGGGQNVRIWNNYIEETMVSIANAACSIGPMYVWRNVAGRSYSPPGSSWNLTHGPFMKMGFANGENWMTGHMYLFNNTLLQPNDQGPNGLGGESRAIKHCISRNNILHVRPEDTHAIATDKRSVDDDFDYDLLSAPRYPAGQEQHGIRGTPRYIVGAGFSFERKTGDFRLADDSPGRGKGVAIPNFCERGDGAPDMGAHATGTPPMVFGIGAEFIPPATVPRNSSKP